MRLDLELNEDGGRSDYPYVSAGSELSTSDVGLATLLRAYDRDLRATKIGQSITT